jgi:alcohol dehydrogenase class IV
MWSTLFRFKYGDVEVFFGPRLLREHLPSIVRGYRKALVVTSRSAARVSGALEDVESILREQGVEFTHYNGVRPNPDTRIANEVSDLARREGVDCIVGIGGGSVIDVAKTASITARSNLRAEDLLAKRVQVSKTIPLIVVNLTHGTGSEVNRFAVLTHTGTIEKKGFVARYPNTSFEDPLYTASLGAKQTLYTTLDAFYHAYEAATSKRTNLLVASLAREVVFNVVSYLSRVLEKPSDLEARTRLLYASMLAGISIDVAGGAHLNHAIEHGFSGLNPDLPHGAGLAMFGPMVVYYTHKAVPEISASILKHIDPTIKPISEDADKARRVVEEFQVNHGFNERLSDYGVDRQSAQRVLDLILKAINERYHVMMPFPVTREVVVRIVESAL